MDTCRLAVEECVFTSTAPNVSLGNGAATYNASRPILRKLFIGRNTFIGELPTRSVARHETFTTDAGGGFFAGFVTSCEQVQV